MYCFRRWDPELNSIFIVTIVQGKYQLIDSCYSIKQDHGWSVFLYTYWESFCIAWIRISVKVYILANRCTRSCTPYSSALLFKWVNYLILHHNFSIQNVPHHVMIILLSGEHFVKSMASLSDYSQGSLADVSTSLL